MNDLVPFDSSDLDESIRAGGIVSSYLAGDRKAQLAVYRAVQASDGALDDMVGQQIDIHHVIMHPVRVQSRESGEIVEAVRTVLVDSAGKRYSTLSPYPARCLQLLASVSGQLPPYDPPLLVRVCKQKRRQGEGGYLQLEVLG